MVIHGMLAYLVLKKYTPGIDLEEYIAQCKDGYERIDYKIIYEIMKSSLLEVTTKMYGLSENDFKEKALVLKSAIESFEWQEDK